MSWLTNGLLEGTLIKKLGLPTVKENRFAPLIYGYSKKLFHHPAQTKVFGIGTWDFALEVSFKKGRLQMGF